MTIRSRDHFTTPGTVRTIGYANNGVINVNDTSVPTSTRCVGSQEYISSVYDGGFTPGKFRVNPVTIYRRTASVTSGVLSYKGTNTACGKEMRAEGPYIASHYQFPTASFDSTQAGYALAKAYAKTKDADVELFVMLGEARETIELLRHPMKAFLKALHKGPASSFTRVADAASGTWLTWMFGVMPLIRDISSIIELASKKMGQVGGLKSKRAKTASTTSTRSSTPSGWMSFSFNADRTTTVESSYTAVVYYILAPSHVSPWDSRVLGYSWPQLPQNLWELVRFSFVVDWVFDVGSWLSNLTPDPSVTYLGNCVSQKSVCKYTVKSADPKFCAIYPLNLHSPSEYVYTEEKLERRVNLSLPALPVYNRRFLDLKNLISELALIWANLPRNWRRS